MASPYGAAPEWEEFGTGTDNDERGPDNAAVPHLSLPVSAQLGESNDADGLLYTIEARVLALKHRMLATGQTVTDEEVANLCKNLAYGSKARTSGSRPIYVRRLYVAFNEDAASIFLEGGSVSSLFRSITTTTSPELESLGWAGSISAMRRAVKLMIRILLLDSSSEGDGGKQLEVLRAELRSMWKESDADLYHELFARSVILNGIRAIGVKALPSFLTRTAKLELPNAKVFLYPYLISKKFRSAMFILCQAIIDALNCDTMSAQDASMVVGIESWDSPKLLEIIQHAWMGWSIHAFTVDLLYFLHAEGVTAVSREDNSLSTLVCAVQLPELLHVEQSLAIVALGDECDISLAWDKIAVIELLIHEFCRVWRRMVQPATVALTPRPVGSSDDPNAGVFVDLSLWGPLLSTDLRCHRRGVKINATKNTENLLKALDIKSWDDPNVNFWWHDRPGDHRSDRRYVRRRTGISSERMALF